ncbi:glycosyltransferase family 32 protein [Xylariaceae sp. FL0804]|nr:glycosyltransferase family 32 protein [Xylariaceae sp. FL0804]
MVTLRRRRFCLIPLVLGLVLFGPFLWPTAVHLGARIRQTHPFSYQWKVQQAFVATPDELDCLRGTAHALPTETDDGNDDYHYDDDDGDSDGDGDGDGGPIPNHVHFIYGLSNPYYQPSAGTFDFLAYLAVRSAIVGMRADNITLHYTYLASPPAPEPNARPTSNPWVQRLLRHDRLALEYHAPAETAALKSAPGAPWQAAHVSDILRLRLLHARGGIYLDTDAFGLRPFDGPRRQPRGAVLGHEGGDRGGLCNAVLAARRGSRFVARWLRAYENVDLSREWNEHSVRLPKRLQLEPAHRGEVCALAPDAFFWPTWTWHHVEFMHAPLPPDEARAWAAELRRNGGSLFEGQLAYHAWSQMAWDRYLRWLTPEAVRSRDTRFNLMVRPFLEDDLGVGDHPGEPVA